MAPNIVPSLEADIRDSIVASSADPKPFVWTETASEILTSLANDLKPPAGGDTG